MKRAFLFLVCLLLLVLPAEAKGKKKKKQGPPKPTPEQVKRLRYWIGQLGARHEAKRGQAVDALAKSGPLADMAVPNLTHCLKDTDEAVRLAAVTALGKVGVYNKNAHKTLIKLVAKGDQQARRAAAAALGDIGPQGGKRKRREQRRRRERSSSENKTKKTESVCPSRSFLRLRPSSLRPFGGVVSRLGHVVRSGERGDVDRALAALNPFARKEWTQTEPTTKPLAQGP